MEVVFIRKVKRGVSESVWGGYVVADDLAGLWVFSPQGSRYRTEEHGEVVWSGEVGQGSRAHGIDVLHLVPRASWWFAHISDTDDIERVYVDVCTPCVRTGSGIRFDDLYVDVYRNSTGVLGIYDAEELDAAHGAGLVTSAERSTAMSVASSIQSQLRVGTPPFDDEMRVRLNRCRELELPAVGWP